MDLDSSDTLHCLWGTGCDGEFGDWSTLDEHIYRTHIKPQNQVKCKWDNCDQATDPNEIIDHVRTDHSTSSSGNEEDDQQTCHWSGCSSMLPPGLSGLEKHVESMHVPTERRSVECQWDSCGVTMEDPTDLSMHLQTDHFPDSPLHTTESADSSTNAPRSSPSKEEAEANLQICRWIITVNREEGNGEEEALCGSQFDDVTSLQDHLKEEHLKPLSKWKTGFSCRWEDCPRDAKQTFHDKSKLEIHLRVHTRGKRITLLLNGPR